ncbi:glutathione S-transferase family protein [Methylorubrum populi]|jgi:glutathione S-transferase|uniref:Glutathione S-transferase family protein n=1 Tax=Methylorubrum rhodesianum TaxID=29427 RepID=A0ABU9ZBF0_9HYPH|nr:glutathione S-transferase family protein [Methylorubrum rhodesianum]MBK3404999.1 glutathione S-transferase family protein [Methylorubrum rhodesianum]MBY0138934.1 glutathione S-transferase family protein [Methylorubrum populi]
MLTVYGDRKSGNCLKVAWVAAHLGIDLDWREVDILKGETRTPGFLALNPDGRVPTLVLEDERSLSESNAIIGFLARDSVLIPADAFAQAKMRQWLFWEQYSHEPFIAVRRFQLLYLGRTEASLDPRLFERGHAALALMEGRLADRPFLVGDALSLADVALVAYTRLAHEGGFDLLPYPALRAWIARVEAALGMAG